MELETRVAVLENIVQEQTKKHDEMMTAFMRHMDKEEARFEEIQRNTARQKGFIGGVVFVISAMWAAIIGIIHYMK